MEKVIVPILVMAQPVGAPHEVFSTGFENTPNLMHVDTNILRMKVFYERGADCPVERFVGKI